MGGEGQRQERSEPETKHEDHLREYIDTSMDTGSERGGLFNRLVSKYVRPINNIIKIINNPLSLFKVLQERKDERTIRNIYDQGEKRNMEPSEIQNIIEKARLNGESLGETLRKIARSGQSVPTPA